MKSFNSRKNQVFISLVDPSETRKSRFFYNWLKTGTFQPNFDQVYFFDQQSQLFGDVMQKEIKILEFVQGVRVEFTDSLKNNGTK